MLQLRNDTPFQADRSILLDKEGNQVWVVAVKATYRLYPDGHLELASRQEPVCKAPEYLGTPERSSLRRECELVLDHPGTDIILNASAHAPAGNPVKELDVGIRVGSLTKVLRVTGDRHWERGVLGIRSSPPKSFEKLPITYERAYGGHAPDQAEPPPFEPRNPAGRGFTLTAPEDGTPLPNVEYPRQRVSSWKDRPPPAGFGALASWWSPRKEYAGTYDQKWQEQRMPLWPEDYDPRHHLSAPVDQVSDAPPRFREEVELTNLTPGSRVAFRAPAVPGVVGTRIDHDRYRQPVQLERIIIEPDEEKLVMVWRSWMNCGRDARRVSKSLIWTKRVVG